MELLRQWQHDLHEQWEAGLFMSDDPQVTLQANAQAIGQIRQLKRIIELSHEELSEGLSSEQ